MVNFNPRPREEGDAEILERKFKLCISIHALVKRATNFEAQTHKIYGHFNPRPREEGDRQSKWLYLRLGYFNPRPREEGDDLFLKIVYSLIIFQSTPS